MLQTGWLINNRHLLVFWSLEVLKSKVLAVLVPGENLLPVHNHLCTVCTGGGRGTERYGISFIRAFIHGGSSLTTWSSPKSPPPNTITLGIRFQCRSLVGRGGDTNIQSMTSLHSRSNYLVAVSNLLLWLHAELPWEVLQLGAGFLGCVSTSRKLTSDGRQSFKPFIKS